MQSGEGGDPVRHTLQPAKGPLIGTVRVPGDKSISHRGVLFAAMTSGSCQISGALDSADVRSTIGAVAALGAVVEVRRSRPGVLDVTVTGWGRGGPRADPGAPIDCGNSGTTARLLMGVLAGHPVDITLTGDASLTRRPMRRVTEPLTKMGASISTGEGGTLPVTVHGGQLRGIDYELPVASAQMKSAVLLAGLAAQGRTTVREPAPSRDHTERLLPAFGVGVGRDIEENACWVDGPADLSPSDVSVPGDPSSAAFLVGAGVIVAGSELHMPDVALNPTRIGFLRVLEAMGADVSIRPERSSGAEPCGELLVRGGRDLTGVIVPASEAPSLIDEVPLLAVVAACAHGTTRFEGVGELRVKESDRLAAVAEGLTAMGATVRSGEDWLEVDGPAALHAATLSSLGDHRLAMAWAVGALVADGPVVIDGWDAIDVSYPTFGDELGRLLARG
jgi:3-phosphoshikimate 1-carboxyvinyltransferase